MQLLIAQHGHALSKEQDPNRPLSDQGIKDVTRVARFLLHADVEIPLIWHSGKTRAQQSALQLVSHALKTAQIEEHHGLAPKDDVQSVADEITARSDNLLIVGHLPHVDKLSAYLLTGDESAGCIAFEPGAVLGLEYIDDKWRVAFMVTPAVCA